jgi:diguanylate cyclase (GGDEF)-like protein
MRVRDRVLAGVIAVAVALGLLLQVADHHRASETFVGILVETRASAIVLVRTEPDRPAELAGLRPGDVLVSIAGLEITNLEDFRGAADRFQRGVPAPFEIERGGQRLVLPVVPGASYPWRADVLLAIAALAHLALGLLAWRQARNDLRARLLAIFALAVAVELAIPNLDPWGLGTLSAALGYALNGLQIGTELHLASVIPRLQPWLEGRRWVLRLYYVLGLGGAAIAITSVVVDDLGLIPGISIPVLAAWEGPGYLLWALALLSLLLLQAVRFPEPEGRQQAALVLSGVLPWIAYTVVGQVSVWLGLLLPSWVYPLWPIAVLLYPVAVFVAIFRYHLFDLEAVVKRSLIYTTLTSLLLVLFYATVALGGLIFSARLAEPPSATLVAVAALLAGMAFAPLRRGIEAFVAQRVFPERLAMRRRLVALAGELPALGALPAMGRRLVERLVAIFGVRAATILIADPKTGVLVTLASSIDPATRDAGPSLLLAPDDPGIAYLRKNPRAADADTITKHSPSLRQRLALLDASLVVPLVFNEQLVGLVAVAAKSEGSRFRAEELELLGLLGHHVASVLENARLFESATYESLTGVLRREAVLDILDREVQRASRYGRPLAVAMVDLDHFKSVNDRFGHLGGDGVLQRVAQVLRNELRSTDVIGRYGGEEFLVVLPETSLEGASAVAEKIRETTAATTIAVADKESVTVTVSIGLAELAGGHVVGARELLRRADEALYSAKHAGRNRVWSWQPVSPSA